MIRSKTLAIVIAIGLSSQSYGQDWPQWRGPTGQGTTSAKDLPPTAGSASLKEIWKAPIPGEGCSSPIVCDGRIYLTTAYEGSERHPWDRAAFWTSVLLAGGAAALALQRTPGVWRAFAGRSIGLTALGVWTIAALALAGVVLAKPRWFWQFADPWSGTRVATAELPWVEAWSLRPVIVLFCGSLAPLFTHLANRNPGDALLTRWLGLVTLVVTLEAASLSGLIAWRPEGFFETAQPWPWLVAGGLGLFAYGGSLGWLAGGRWRMLPALVGVAIGGWMFANTPGDEFASPLSVQNRLAYLVPGGALLCFFVWVFRFPQPPTAESRSSGEILFVAMTLLAIVVFVRANFLQPQSGVVRAVICLDAKTGQVQWTTPVYVAPSEKRHSLNSLATPTPACDGERIYADYGSGLAALDRDGRVLWLKRDPEFANHIRYGAGSSVVLAGEHIVIYRDSEFMGHGDHLDDNIQEQKSRRPSTLAAYDKKTGDIAWSVTPSFSHDSYMTPLVWTRDGRREVVVATWKTLAGFDLADGSLNWTHAYPMQQIVPSLAVNGDSLIVTGGNELPCPINAIRPPINGAKGESVWFVRMLGGNIVSPVCWNGQLYSMSHHGVMVCQDADTGRVHWTKRLGRSLASLVAGDDKIYVLNQDGTLHVVAADGSILASLSLSENASATPAIASGMLIARTAGHLVAIGD